MEKFQGRHVQQPEIAILKGMRKVIKYFFGSLINIYFLLFLGMRKDISHIIRLQVSVKTLRPGIRIFLFILDVLGAIFILRKGVLRLF